MLSITCSKTILRRNNTNASGVNNKRERDEREKEKGRDIMLVIERLDSLLTLVSARQGDCMNL